MRAWIGIIGLLCAFGAQAAPRVAVADMAFQERVEQYIRIIAARARESAHANAYSAGHRGSASYDSFEARYSYIKQGELRKFSGDIKGEILKSRMFQLVQGTPYTPKAKQDVYDVIARIKSGSFKGADYVLFGTVSDIDFRQDINALAHTGSYSAVLGLTLVADFSLINTRTLEITSAFTAMGEGQDTKLVNSRDIKVSLNRGRVVRDVSRSISLDVTRQLREQLRGEVDWADEPIPQNSLPQDEAPRILR